MSIWSACILCIVSNVVMMTATNVGALYAGRLLIGLANGLFMTFAQLYLQVILSSLLVFGSSATLQSVQECAPARYRGLMIGAFQSWTSIGSLVGTIIDNFSTKIGGKQSYIVPLGIVYVVPGIIALGLLIVPESPRWLLFHGKEEAARKSLLWLRPFPETVETELTEMRASMEAEKALASGTELMDMWRNPIDRRRTVLAILAVTLQAASGAMYMICKYC